MRTKKGAQNFKGFSLMGTMVSMAILGIVAVAMMQLGEHLAKSGKQARRKAAELTIKRDVAPLINNTAMDSLKLQKVIACNGASLGPCAQWLSNTIHPRPTPFSATYCGTNPNDWKPVYFPKTSVNAATGCTTEPPQAVDEGLAGLYDDKGRRCAGSHHGFASSLTDNPYSTWTTFLNANPHCSIALFTYWRCEPGTPYYAPTQGPEGSYKACRLQFTYALWSGFLVPPPTP